MMKIVKRKKYAAPTTEFVELNGERSICQAGVGTGSKSTDSGGLAKHDNFSLWEEDESASTASQTNLWED